MKKISLFLYFFIILSCSNDGSDIRIDENNLLLDLWINPKYKDKKTIFERVETLKDDDYGIQFLTKNIYTERSSGWCGIPPLIFNDFEGLWNQKNNNIRIDIDNGMNRLQEVKWKINYALLNILA